MIIEEIEFMDVFDAIEDARRNIYEDSKRFDLSRLWRKWTIGGGLSNIVMNKLGLIEVSGDPRWDHILEDSMLAVYSDDLGRIWIVQDDFGKICMRLFASDSLKFEKIMTNRNKSLKAA